MDNPNATKKVIFAVGVIVNLIIAICCILSVPHKGEFASALLGLGEKIEIAFIGIVFTFGFFLIVHLVCKYWNNYSVFVSMILVVAMNIGYLSISMSIVSPKQYTEAEIKTKQQKKLNEMIKKGDKMLAKSENKIIDHVIISEDSVAIISYFNHFLDSAFYRYSDSIKLEYSSTFHHFFNRNLIRRPYGRVEMIFNDIETNKYRQIIKNNLSIDLFSYSPDKRKLFIIMTYNVGYEQIEANALALIGERNEDQIILYKFRGFRNDYGVMNKQYALYEIITSFEDKANNYNPLKKSFWDGRWYEKVRINKTEKYRYQLDDYAYKWNEEKQYNERVTAEIETFIVIER
jgi:hypothetical protein